jgi:hypothetical protein
MSLPKREAVMRKPERIELTDHQRPALLTWGTAGKTEQRLAKRGHAILCGAAGRAIMAMQIKPA